MHQFPVGVRRPSPSVWVQNYFSSHRDTLLAQTRHLGGRVSSGVEFIRAQAEVVRTKPRKKTFFAKPTPRRDRSFTR